MTRSLSHPVALRVAGFPVLAVELVRDADVQVARVLGVGDALQCACAKHSLVRQLLAP